MQNLGKFLGFMNDLIHLIKLNHMQLVQSKSRLRSNNLNYYWLNKETVKTNVPTLFSIIIIIRQRITQNVSMI